MPRTPAPAILVVLVITDPPELGWPAGSEDPQPVARVAVTATATAVTPRIRPADRAVSERFRGVRVGTGRR